MHAQDAFLPAADDRACADAKLVRLAAIQGAIEFGAVGERAGVIDDDRFAEPRLFAGADDFVNILEARSRGDFAAGLLAAAGKPEGASGNQRDDEQAAPSWINQVTERQAEPSPFEYGLRQGALSSAAAESSEI